MDEDIYNKAYILDNKLILRCIESFFKESNNYKSCLTLYCPLECDSFAYDISVNSQAIIGYGNISNNSYFYDWYTQFNTYENVSKSFGGSLEANSLRIFAYRLVKLTVIA